VIGAFVNCWIAVEDAEQAEDLARNWITDAGWHVVRIDTRVSVSRDDERDPDAAERIQEAREHGGSLVFPAWGQGGEPVVG
jgi:hypothetical protein